MKIVWHSNSPTAPSGYGVQTAMFVPRLATLGHEISISAPYSYGGMPLQWGDHVLEGAVRDQCGNDIIVARYGYHDADLLMTLCDPFGLLASAKDLAKINVAMWFPVDCHPLGEADVTVLRESQAIPIAMSKFGLNVLRHEGADPLFVPHGVDIQLFSPGDQEDYREPAEIDPDTFVIGINAMNRDKIRKGFSEQMMAFKIFHDRHPNSVLALHTAPVNNSALNLTGWACRLGIIDAVRFPDEYTHAAALIPQEQMATWYRGLDILSACSYGEGFCLPVIEAQACGTPVVVTQASALPEICGSGWMVSGTDFIAPEHGALWTRPNVEDIAEAYEMAWQAKQDNGMLAMRHAAWKFAQLYDADRVFHKYWKPAMDEIAERIGAG